MPPKRAAATPATKKAAAGHASYRDMIKDAIVNLKERNGSSRQSIKKYVQNNNDLNNASPAVFDNQFNKAIKAGVEKGDFTQPKGPSGPLKLAKKDAAEKPAPKKAAPAKAAPAKAATTKKAAPKKTEKAEKAEKAEKTETAPKKTTKSTTKKATTATKKKTAAKPKANTAKPRKTPVAAPAIIEKPKIISTTKSGRVTKTTAQPESAPKRAAPKKA
ncbi:histone H1/H5 family protein [Aspergillus ruber CBS 135680]|uniref:Histone H1 n=1 Tax=Aspergillus ruber (strain CBS 135680) TaxID=1388766 RepID=A0A017SHV5_ASPRC|nr:uncharacterized protein EURHEDRAFT_411386 [Aspergillus ruber CBS 135680]EYE96234.1 hypothetical protein EURHEDRAFT_411386 [Aspergillus ruber CBS 135680]